MPVIATARTHVHFSGHFGIKATQSQLDFVDIPLDTDVPLFVDPYAFKVNGDLWSIECNNLLIDFFQRLLEAIRSGDLDEARNLVRPLKEPNATRLGLSQGQPNGKGMGPVYTAALVDHLRRSRAFRTGQLRDLCDCELMIPHVSNDRISDIASNVILRKLCEFTAQQCQLHGVNTRSLPAGPAWDADNGFWIDQYCDLPVCKHKPLILVPKNVVRRQMT